MKKLISILLAAVLVISVLPFSISATESAQVLPAPDLAYTSIGNAIAKDAQNDTTTSLSDTNWSFQYGASLSALTEQTIAKTGPFGTYVYGSGAMNRFPTSTPTGYTFGTVSVAHHIQNVAVYNKTTHTGIGGNATNSEPSSGVIFSVSQRKDHTADDWFSITYTAPYGGKLKLNDPNGGNIASLWSLGKDSQNVDCKVNCVYGVGSARNVKFAIYKNDEKIWPIDNEVLFYHDSNSSSEKLFYTAFPTLENISVAKGDKIRLAFDGSTNTTDCSMAFALNPQVSYTEIALAEGELPIPDVAYASIKNALSTDAATPNAPSAIDSTNWSFSRGESITAVDSGFTVSKVGNFGFYRNGITESAKLTNAYVFNSQRSYYRDNITVYERDNSDIESAVRTGYDRPATGIVFALTQIRDLAADNCFSINYTAKYNGKITLSDPDGGYVANIGKIGGVNTACADDSAKVKRVDFAIYKNNEKIWPTGTEQKIFEYGTYYHAFPTLENISVKEGDVIKIAFTNADENDSQSYATAFALNPRVAYTELTPEEEEEEVVVVYSDNAYTNIGNAVNADKTTGTTKEYFKLDWSFMHGDSFETLEEYTIEKIGPFGTYRFSGEYERLVPKVTPDGYIFNKVIYDVYDENIAVYDTETYKDIVPNKANTLPSKGVMFSVSQHATRTEDDWFSMTYTAPHGGVLNLSDLDGGKIASIASFGTTEDGKDATTLCANDGDNKQVRLAIYKNDKKIWPKDTDYFVFKGNSYATDFPKLKDIEVEVGDKLHITFNGISTGGSYSMAFALNPTVSYTVVEPFKLEDQDILDMIDDTKTSNSAEVFKTAIDADAATGQANYLGADSPWSIQKSTVGYKYGWSELSANYVKNFFVLNLSVSGWPPITNNNFPYGYQFDNVWAGHDWAVYDTNNTEEASLTGRGNLPETGMLGYFHKHDSYYALCYKAQKSGTYRLYDPNKTDIATVSHIDGTYMNSLDTDQKRLHIAIYKNDEKIWPTDAEYFELNKNKGSVPFPDIQGIQMNSDDTLRIIFKNASENQNGAMLSNMIVALNPQVDFVNYFKSTHSGTGDVDKAIKTDIENGRDGYAGDTQTSILYTDYLWRVETQKNGAWELLSPMAVEDLKLTVQEGTKVPSVLPFGAVQLGAYDSTHGLASDVEIEDSGLLLSVTDPTNSISLTYVVTDEKYIRIRDIFKGKIALVKEICGTQIETPDNIKCSIYHNDKKLWPEDDIMLSEGKAKFPDISVATEEEDRIRIVFEVTDVASAKPFMVAMNPHITGYSIAVNKVITTEIGALEAHNAYSEISAALKSDLKAKKPAALKKTGWKVESSTDFGTAQTPTWTEDALGYEDAKNNIPMTYTQRFTVYNSASAPTSNWPMAYAYNYNKFLATYDQSNNVKAFNVSRLPQTGVMLTTMNRKQWHSLTWVANKDGEIHLYDPVNSYITAIKSIDSVELRAHDYDANYSKDVEIAIYKNNEKLWPTDSDWFVAKSEGANEEKSAYFPDCVGVEVSKGDAIRIVIHSAGDSDTIPAVIAMNPQVDYTAIDYIRLSQNFADKAPSDETNNDSDDKEDNKPSEDEEETEDVILDLEDDYQEEIIEDNTDIEEEPEEEQVVIRRKKKVIKTTKKVANVWKTVLIIGGAVLAVLAAAGAAVLIVIKRRKARNGG